MVKIPNEMISMSKNQLPILATSNKNRDPQLILLVANIGS